MHSVPTDGQFRELHYVKYGHGRPVIALHGYGQTAYSWRHLVSAPPEGLAFYLFDLRGCGKSGTPKDERYSPSDQAQDICEFVRQSNLKDVTLIGHSMGGGIALLAALELLKGSDLPLRSLVLVDSMALPQQVPFFLRFARNPVLGPLVLSCVPSRFLIRFVLRQAFHDSRKIEDNAVRAYASNLSSAGGRYAMMKTAQQLIPADADRIIERYRTITIPTLILWGGDDRIIPPANGATLNAAIPRSALFLIKDCGHIPHEETPHEAIPTMLEFLAGP